MLNQLDPSKTELQPLFPTDRPDVQTPPERQPIAPEVLIKMPANQLVDMEICDMVNSRLELSKNWRRTRRIIWDKCWQNMKAVYDKTGKASWQSMTFQPATAKVVEVIVANLYAAILAPETPVEWQTRRSDMDQLVRSINEVIQADLDKCSFKIHLTDWIRTLCVCGTAIGKVDYIKQEETVMIKQRQQPSAIDGMLQAMGINSQEQFVPQKRLVKDYARITNIDIYDIYPQPRVAEFGKDMWVIEYGKITNKELMIGSQDPDPYYRFDNVDDRLLSGSGLQRVDQDPEKQVRRFALLDYNIYSHFLDPDREHELKTFYGPIPLWYLKPELRNDPSRQYESVPGWIQVVDGQYVIRKRITPWRDGEPPYFKGNYIRLADEFYGIGVAELMMGLQIEKNEIRNSRMDNINLSLNKILAVMKDMIPSGEWQRLKSEPGALWLFKGLGNVRDAIQPVEFGDVTKDSWMASREVDQEIQEVTAANKATVGVGGGSDQEGGNTFRGQLLNSQAASERWMLYARVLETMGLIPAMKKFYHRIYQFKSYQDAQETLGGDRAQNFQLIPPEDLEKIAKLVPLGVMTLENKGVKLAQLNQFTQTWIQQPFFKALEVCRAMLIEMGYSEPDKYIFSDEEMKTYNQMKQQMLSQAMGGSALGLGQGQTPPGSNPSGLLGPSGQPMPGQPGPQTGSSGNVPGGQPVAGNVAPGPAYGMPRPALPARGPGMSPMDLHGRPLS